MPVVAAVVALPDAALRIGDIVGPLRADRQARRRRESRDPSRWGRSRGTRANRSPSAAASTPGAACGAIETRTPARAPVRPRPDDTGSSLLFWCIRVRAPCRRRSGLRASPPCARSRLQTVVRCAQPSACLGEQRRERLLQRRRGPACGRPRSSSCAGDRAHNPWSRTSFGTRRLAADRVRPSPPPTLPSRPPE